MSESRPVRISILGSTGSIGTQVLDVVKRLGHQRVRIVGLGAQNNADLLISQALEFMPKAVCIGDGQAKDKVESTLSSCGIRVYTGKNGFDELAVEDETDKIVVSVAGTPGLSPTLKAIEAGKDVALASKEVLVAAGHLVMEAASRKGVALLPIDSEHSAIFQCLNGEDRNSIEKIYLTASGGAFRDKPKSELADVTAEQALAHPTWKMGKKVTVDSATLMNKGLEIIEAKWLFGVEADRVEVVIHPTSIVHSMVRFCDGSTIAQLGLPDMRLPIQYALLYPQRVDSKLPKLDILKAGTLSFGEVDMDKFECLGLAMKAAKVGGTLAVVMNAADEVAVDMFLNGRIGFLDIAKVVRRAMERHKSKPSPSLEEIYEVDGETRHKVAEFV
ncbi:1-deoxy-D-xylulose-5-phosphate reductoisomerase [bacterium]|nr:1-deoxy-D-xylulose-5-phosphate reductoisomerase [bacterium]